jgi:hypothetical protein
LTALAGGTLWKGCCGGTSSPSLCEKKRKAIFAGEPRTPQEEEQHFSKQPPNKKQQYHKNSSSNSQKNFFIYTNQTM